MRLAVFPELSLCGYPPQDLLERPDFIAEHDRALNGLLVGTGDIGVALGVIEKRNGSGKPLYRPKQDQIFIRDKLSFAGTIS